jgi:hypothetical protein
LQRVFGKIPIMNAPNLNAKPFVDRIEYLCDFIDSVKDMALAQVPVCMPHDIGSLGFDTPLWVGLGMVGLWATLDAFAERANIPEKKCNVCRARSCVAARFAQMVADRNGLRELEDIRHLYAHNYAGKADQEYFKRPRHVFASGLLTTLNCGGSFNGSEVNLELHHLRIYCALTKRVLDAASG